jgi:hypothetical protein
VFPRPFQSLGAFLPLWVHAGTTSASCRWLRSKVGRRGLSAGRGWVLLWGPNTPHAVGNTKDDGLAVVAVGLDLGVSRRVIDHFITC